MKLRSPTETVLRLGTRGSLLARTQSRLVAEMIELMHPGIRVEEVIHVTSGDVIADRPLHEFGGKGLFTKELELALLHGSIDFAVHSFKDVPITQPLVSQNDLIIAAVPGREDARDVLVSHIARRIADLPRGARVGTGSLRRQCQLRTQRPDLLLTPIRGNIDTRLRRLKEGAFDAIVLALAGIKRCGLYDAQYMSPVDEVDMIPAPGQGALALQCRRDAREAIEVLGTLNDPPTLSRVACERELVRLLQGDCLSPIGAHATLRDGNIRLNAAVGARGGELPVLRAGGSGHSPDSTAIDVYNQLLKLDVHRVLHGAAAKE